MSDEPKTPKDDTTPQAPDQSAQTPQTPPDQTPQTPQEPAPVGTSFLPTEGGDGTPGTQSPEGAPDQYDFNLPSGIEMTQEALGKFGELAKDMNLSQAQAQSLLDFQGNEQAKIREQVAIATHQQQQDWEAEIMRDPDLGGARFNSTMGAARRAFEKFGSPEMASIINELGLNGHPAFVRFLHAIGKGLAEDTHVSGQGPPSRVKSDEEILYPHLAR